MSSAIAAYGLQYRYPDADAPVLDEVTFELERGHVVALLGANGSGKSTLLRILAGVLPLATGGRAGIVRLGGKDLQDHTASERATRIIYVGADLRSEFPMTAYEAVSLGGTAGGRRAFGKLSLEDEDRIEWAMNECLCWNLRSRGLDTLSGGERQLVALARALLQGGKVLLLDEALSKMDLHHQARMGEWFGRLREQGYTVVLVAHDWNLACEWADQALVLHRGRIIKSGSVADAVSAEMLKELYPEARLTVGASPVTGGKKVFFGQRR